MEFHGRSPWTPIGQRGRIRLSPWAWTKNRHALRGTRSTGPLGRRAKNLNEFPNFSA
jgi:hypothetical protein